MSAPSLIESFELLRFSELFHGRLQAARDELEARRGFEREKQWMGMADELLELERRPAPALIERARCLPELAEAAAEMASAFQEIWVDALEKFQAGIMFHVGSRSPVIEAVFPHQKFPALRRASKDAAIAYSNEFERRLKTGYVTRMMQGEEFGFAKAVLEQIAAAYAKWHSCFVPPPVPEDEAAKIREELPALARRVELATGQARLLAEAALLPFEGLYDGSGLNAKPRRRARADAADALPTEAPAPAAPEALGDEPSAEEAAELAAAREGNSDKDGEAAEPATAAAPVEVAEAKPAPAAEAAPPAAPIEAADAAADEKGAKPKGKRSKKSTQVPEA